VQAQLPRTCEQQEPEMTRSSHKQATLWHLPVCHPFLFTE
jgi:hypothetical protein